MIHSEGLEFIATLISGLNNSVPLVLHLDQSFTGYQPIVLDATKWFIGADGYIQQEPVIFALHHKETVKIQGCYLAFSNGIKLYSEKFDEPRILYYSGDEMRIIPRYKLYEASTN